MEMNWKHNLFTGKTVMVIEQLLMLASIALLVVDATGVWNNSIYSIPVGVSLVISGTKAWPTHRKRAVAELLCASLMFAFAVIL